MSISITALREQIYKVIDRIIKTGTPQEIERNGHKLKIILVDKVNKLDNLTPHNTIVGDPNELVDIKVGKWEEKKNL